MSSITWDNSYSTGITKIDEQHKILFEMLNRACENAECKGDEQKFRQLAADMMAYAFMHFSTEEEYMQAYGYPEEASHARMHDDFKVVAMEYEFAAEQGNADPAKLTGFLIDWLAEHVRGEDRHLGDFLIERGAS